ncbi:MAG: hypothetical protein ACJ8FU_08525 [Xanthobacteraceae bacterium]
MNYIYVWALLVLGPLIVAVVVMAETLDRRLHHEFMASIDTLTEAEKARLTDKVRAHPG